MWDFSLKNGNLNKDEIGRIDVKDHYSFAAVSRKKIKQTLNLIQNEKIKGVKTADRRSKIVSLCHFTTPNNERIILKDYFYML